eukprot:2976761-Rhodomonas_salina.2
MSGRAEPIRLCFTIGDVKFEDERINRDQLMEGKASGRFPLGSLPVLEVDGKVVCQSYAMQNYAAKISGLYPKE